MNDDRPFWESKSLTEMTRSEWESLCDGCGRCCIVTLEDEDDPGTFEETSVHCKLFDPEARRCTCYAKRTTLVPGCVELKPDNVAQLDFMPSTCAYRRLSEGKGLADWHPLISGDLASVEKAGVAVSRDLTSELEVREEDLWRYLTNEKRRG
ncbi:MAG: YcgN family cysteine cluster protein [Pseudomonadota bacterium]